LIAASSAVSRKKFKESKNTLSVYANHLSLLLLRVGRAEKAEGRSSSTARVLSCDEFLAEEKGRKKQHFFGHLFVLLLVN
jgi:hypothetical protein